ncbi:MAG: hypothetical protein Q9161_001028 [Pseudevernia consocians]
MRRPLSWRKKPKAVPTRTHDAAKTLSTCNETPNAEGGPTSMQEPKTVSNVGSTASQAVVDSGTPNAEGGSTSMHELNTVSNVGSIASQAVGDFRDTHPPRDLWDRAYDLLMENEDGRKLMGSYEKVLLPEVLDKDVPVQASNSLAGFDKEKRMSELIIKKLDIVEKARWTFNVGDKTVEVKAQVDRIVKAVLYAKDFVSSAVGSEPHAALAWAGVCVLLPQEALAEGLDQISNMILCYKVYEETHSQEMAPTATTASLPTNLSRLSNALETNITGLYSQILGYQAHVVCQLFRHKVVQFTRDVFKAVNWATLLKEIKSTDKLCKESFTVIDSSRLQQGFEKQAYRTEELHTALKSSLQALEQNTDMLMENRRTDKESELLQACLLWVTADPGCGKSVLSKSLIEHEFRNEHAEPTTTCCYFFFKDDSDDQKSVSKAVCALLHQILYDCKKPRLLKKATEFYRSLGTNMMTSFVNLWELFLSIAQDQEAGEVLCILDALDECKEGGRKQLIDALNKFHASIKPTDGRLKILVTSRPYIHIEHRFDDSTTIRLAGEDESEQIGKEIDLVIRASVPRIATQLKMDCPTQSVLQQKLLATSNRTYLWLHLILEDVVTRSLEVDTPKRMEKFLKKLPATIYEAYEHMLIQSPKPEQARTLLHIVLAATRPLTLKEMNMALNIEKGQKSSEEVDLQPDGTFPAYIKNICGLFVSIVDSKIYLLHQTAKEFLESQGGPISSNVTDHNGQMLGPWKHSMEPSASNLVLAKICLIYLLFDDFQSSSYISHSVWSLGNISVKKNAFLIYASQNWAAHFRFAKRDSDAFKYWFEVCNTKSQWFSAWLKLHWSNTKGEPWLFDGPLASLEPITLASILGHDAILSQLIGEGASVNSTDSKGRTALFWAAKGGYESIVKLLVESGAELQSQNCRENSSTALVAAAVAGQTTIVEYLLDKGASLCFNDTEFHPDAGYNSLAYATNYGHSALVEKIIMTVDGHKFKKTGGGASITIAARHGHWSLVQCLLKIPGARANPQYWTIVA